MNNNLNGRANDKIQISFNLHASSIHQSVNYWTQKYKIFLLELAQTFIQRMHRHKKLIPFLIKQVKQRQKHLASFYNRMEQNINFIQSLKQEKQNMKQSQRFINEKKRQYFIEQISLLKLLIPTIKNVKDYAFKRQNICQQYCRQLKIFRDQINILTDNLNRHQQISILNKEQISYSRKISHIIMYFQQQFMPWISILFNQINQYNQKMIDCEEEFLQLQKEFDQLMSQKLSICDLFVKLGANLIQQKKYFDFQNPENNSNQLTEKIMNLQKQFSSRQKLKENKSKYYKKILQKMFKSTEQMLLYNKIQEIKLKQVTQHEKCFLRKLAIKIE